MRHGRWGRAHGWASVPPTASQSIAASSVDAAWGSGHHHETHMQGARGVPPPRAASCHAVACGPRRRRATCACHTRNQTHTHQGARGWGGGSGGRKRERAASRVGHQRKENDSLDSLLPRELEILGCRRRWHMADGALTRGHWAAAAHSGDVRPRTHPHTTHHPRTHWGNT